MDKPFTKIGQLKNVAEFRQHVAQLGLDLPCDGQILAGADSPMSKAIQFLHGGDLVSVGNRWCVQPMEGWDGTKEGLPSEAGLRRWEHFGRSGAKLIWGGEAFAVQNDGRANPNQIGVVDDDVERAEAGLRRLLARLKTAHREGFGSCDDLFVGLQLTHSGRYCRPVDKKKLEPRIVYNHPLLDGSAALEPISDDYIERVIENYVRAARLAWRAGFQFVDVKHCHGYLGHEMLSAFTRPGRFGGSFENRTRFAREIIAGIQAECPGLSIGVRVSAFDFPPFRPDPARSSPGRPGPGIPADFGRCLPYVYGFGCNPNNPLEIDLTEPIALVKMLGGLGVRLINVTCGSPYYCPHIQRPAAFPPSDGYLPPEDPLVGVARLLGAAREIKRACPGSIVVGTGYSYLQEYLPQVAQAAVREGWVDSVGFGRLALSYWELPADTLAGRAMESKRLCRTFSDCTTGPRNGLISGCFPLDPFYKESAENGELKRIKREGKSG
jgi:2,4-dienoyl-CoA reductase-like NADH-dependent reductase (Old Yellow Enzyme family)